MKKRNPDNMNWDDLPAEDRRQLTYVDEGLEAVYKKQKGKSGLQLAALMKELEPGGSFFINRSEWTSKKGGPGRRIQTYADKWNQSFEVARNGRLGWTVTRIR